MNRRTQSVGKRVKIRVWGALRGRDVRAGRGGSFPGGA